MKAENFDELEQKQNELREIRNKKTKEYQAENDAIQKEIDELDMQKYCADKFLNNYISIGYKDSTVYMYVTKIDRLYRGCRYSGFGFINYDEHTLSIYTELEMTVDYDQLEIVNIVTKDQYYNARQDILDKFTKISEHTV